MVSPRIPADKARAALYLIFSNNMKTQKKIKIVICSGNVRFGFIYSISPNSFVFSYYLNIIEIVVALGLRLVFGFISLMSRLTSIAPNFVIFRMNFFWLVLFFA